MFYSLYKEVPILLFITYEKTGIRLVSGKEVLCSLIIMTVGLGKYKNGSASSIPSFIHP